MSRTQELETNVDSGLVTSQQRPKLTDIGSIDDRTPEARKFSSSFREIVLFSEIF